MQDVEKTSTVLLEKPYAEHVESASSFGGAAAASEHPEAVKVPARIFTPEEEDKLCRFSRCSAKGATSVACATVGRSPC